MDRLATMALFVRIVERGSFSAAAADRGISRPAATAAIQDLERRLGSRLLNRTTRQVRPTTEGEDFRQRCAAILAEIEDAERSAGGAVSGLIRVDVAGLIARELLLPALPTFLARYPELTVHLGEGERFVDLIREGIDCVVRAGDLADSNMMVRHLGTIEEITCASPIYLGKQGIPSSPDDLDGHHMVGFVSSRGGRTLPLEFMVDGKPVEIMLPARVLVGAADTSAAAARLGLGLIQAPRMRFADDLARGTLVEVLPNHRPLPTPISLLYPEARQLAPRVRAFVDWAADLIKPALDDRR